MPKTVYGTRGKVWAGIFVVCGIMIHAVSIGTAFAGMLEDRVNGYSFTYPDDWQARLIQHAGPLIKGEINKDKSTGMQIRVYDMKENTLRGFVDGYAEDFRKQMEGHWGGMMTVLESRFVSIGGYEAYVMSFDFTRRDKKRWFFKQFFWPRNNQALVLQTGTPYASRAMNEPIIDRIAGTLRMAP